MQSDAGNTMGQTFLVLGAGHSGTSTLAGMINMDSKALCLFEVDFSEGRQAKYRSRYEHHFSQWDYLFGASRDTAWSLGELLRTSDSAYKFVGAKVQELRFDLLRAQTDRTFCTVRRPQSWLSHPSVFRSYALSRGFLHVAIDYVLFIDAAIRSGADMFSLEALYRDPNAWKQILEARLEGFRMPSADWWKKMDSEDPVKRSANWLRAHPTSTREPEDFRPELVFKGNEHLQLVFSAFERMETDTKPRPLSRSVRDGLKVLRNQPSPSVEDLVDTSHEVFSSLSAPPVNRISVRDRVYSKVFGSGTRADHSSWA